MYITIKEFGVIIDTGALIEGHNATVLKLNKISWYGPFTVFYAFKFGLH